MTLLKIISDGFLSASARKLLEDGIGPHEIVFRSKPGPAERSRSGPAPVFADADIAFGSPAVASVLNAPRLRWVHLNTAGYTRYDTHEFRDAVAARGMIFTNSSMVYAQPCAEHVFAFMLAQARRLPFALKGTQVNDSVPWIDLRNSTALLRDQSVVLLGFGAIATRLVEMLRPFGMRIVSLRRRPSGDEPIPIITVAQLPEALAQADHVINLLPANADSTRFMTAARLAAMKPGAIFYNVGRGTTVDQDALLDVLRSGHLGAAWLDVTEPEPLPPDHPLRNVPNCYITPHIAGGHRNETESLARHFLGNLRRFEEGVPLCDRIM